jgi:hypothetical protein
MTWAGDQKLAPNLAKLSDALIKSAARMRRHAAYVSFTILYRFHVPRGFARVVGAALAGSSGQG